MKLIVEKFEDLEYISEQKADGGKNYYIQGIMLQSAVENRNGRVYPEEVMDKEVARYIKEAVDNNTALGELGHPNGPQINLDRVSHRIVSLTKESTNYIGKALITETPMGSIAKGLIKSGVKLGVSSRGMGSLKQNNQGINEVQSDFRLSTAADIVHDPSAPDAWVNGIMENVEWIYDDAFGWRILQIAEEAKTTIKKLDIRKLRENKLKLFEDFMSRISKNQI